MYSLLIVQQCVALTLIKFWRLTHENENNPVTAGIYGFVYCEL